MAISDECWWDILHLGHHAWYQRALMAGDFAPGLTPRSEYIVGEDGLSADPEAVPTCGTCGVVPRTDELEPVERITGRSGHLAAFRAGQASWSTAGKTLEDTCWYCNCPGPLLEGGFCASCLAALQLVRPQEITDAVARHLEGAAAVEDVPPSDVVAAAVEPAPPASEEKE